MALPRKPGPAQAVALVGEAPPIPSLPEEVRDRFPSLVQWEGDFKRWWSDFSEMWTRDRSQIATQFQSDESSASTNLADLKSKLAILSEQLSNLTVQIGQGGNVGALTVQVSELSSRVSALLSIIQGHIAALVAHGAESQIVGQSDVETLDGKTIGSMAPGYGRFQPAIVVNRIMQGQNVTVASGEALVTAGTFTVYGALKVDGSMICL